MMPAVMPGHILTLDLSARASSSLVYFMIQSFLSAGPRPAMMVGSVAGERTHTPWDPPVRSRSHVRR